MIRVIMLDLGNTLIRESDQTRFPHVRESLSVLKTFANEGVSMQLCLVSNFPQQLPVPETQLPQVLDSFVQILDQAELTSFFQPVSQGVTLSAHAGVAKPAAAIFRKALERLGLPANFAECLFVTEDAGHVSHVRGLGMQALQFGGHVNPSPPGTDFSDWAEAPLLIARIAFPNDSEMMKAAVRGFLEMSRKISVHSVSGSGQQFEVAGSARAFIPPGQVTILSGVQVDVPVQIHIRLDAAGRPVHVDGDEPDPGDIAEIALNLQSLVSNGQIAGINESPLGATHQIVTNEAGERILKRKRFTGF